MKVSCVELGTEVVTEGKGRVFYFILFFVEREQLITDKF